MITRTSAPFFEEIRNYIQKSNAIFHTPGHRGGISLGEFWENTELTKLDLTELPGLDWSGSRDKARRLASDLHKADHSFFLVQGATQGVQAALLGCFNPGDQILVARNSHISVFHSLVLADLHPIFIEVEFLHGWGLPAGIKYEALKQAVAKYPDAKGLIVTNPTYQGIANRVALYREVIGDRILIVDEAHGGHFEWWGASGFDAYSAADIWIQGTHKFLGSLTQTAMLHLREGRVDPELIGRRLELITTTSPSFILLASLDANRAFLAGEGIRLFEKKLDTVRNLKKACSDLPGVEVLTDQILADPDKKVDPWRLCLSFLKIGLTGYEVDRILREEYSVQAEYADYNQLTFLIPPWQSNAEVNKLYDAVASISLKYRRKSINPLEYELSVPSLMIQPRQAVFSKVRSLSLGQASGQISAAVIAPYPPGIPLVGPGELFTDSIISLLKEIIKAGGVVNGMNPRGEVLISCIEANQDE